MEHPFSTHEKFSEKLTFLTPTYAHTTGERWWKLVISLCLEPLFIAVWDWILLKPSNVTDKWIQQWIIEMTSLDSHDKQIWPWLCTSIQNQERCFFLTNYTSCFFRQHCFSSYLTSNILVCLASFHFYN